MRVVILNEYAKSNLSLCWQINNPDMRVVILNEYAKSNLSLCWQINNPDMRVVILNEYAKSNLSLCWQINNPDMRVVILNEYAKSNFPSTPLLDYAYEVEKITTSKVCVSRCQSKRLTDVTGLFTSWCP